MGRKPILDETTRQIAERLLNMPPKPHKEMKIGRRKAKAGAKASLKNKMAAGKIAER
jgi:hypothetical protein